MNRDKTQKRSILKFFLIGFGTITLFIISIIIWIVVSLFSGPDAMDINTYHPFRSEEAKVRYLDHYDKRMELWSVASVTRIIETTYGQTFIRISGPEEAPALVLLPGGGCNSLIWLQIIKTLSENYRTYAVDNIYDFGRSVYTRPMTTTNDLLIWLDELLAISIISDIHFSKDSDTPSLPKIANAIYEKVSEFEIKKITFSPFLFFQFKLVSRATTT
jgi:hypothetical protein